MENSTIGPHNKDLSRDYNKVVHHLYKDALVDANSSKVSHKRRIAQKQQRKLV